MTKKVSEREMKLCQFTPPIPETAQRKGEEPGSAHCKKPDASKNFKVACPDTQTKGMLGKQQVATTASLRLRGPRGARGPFCSPGDSFFSRTSPGEWVSNLSQMLLLGPVLLFFKVDFFFLWNWMENSTQLHQGKIQEKTPPAGKRQSVLQRSETPK